MKDIIEYITEKKLDHVALTFAQAEDILKFIDKNKLADKADKEFSGWYETLKSQIDENN